MTFVTTLSRREFMIAAGATVAGCSLGFTASAASPRNHEAKWYESLAGKRIRCALCPRGCVVADGKRGECGVRENRKGKYYTLVYGYPVSRNLDPIEKKPFYHVYPGTKAYSIATVGCNLSCKFCQNWQISQAAPERYRVPYVEPSEIARAAKAKKAKTVAYTYNEPTIFHEYMVDCAKAVKKEGLENIMVSNGYISAKAQEELFPLMKAIKIDLKSFSESFYKKTCNGRLKPVKESLVRLAESKVWFEIVVLLIPTLNDKSDELKRMTEWIVTKLGPDVPVIFTRYLPRYKITNIPATPTKTLERARSIAMAQGCHYAYGGNVRDMKGANTYCHSCGALLVDRYRESVVCKTTGKCVECKTTIPGVWK